MHVWNLEVCIRGFRELPCDSIDSGIILKPLRNHVVPEASCEEGCGKFGWGGGGGGVVAVVVMAVGVMVVVGET